MKKRLSLALLTLLMLNTAIPVQAASIESQLADLALKGAQFNTKAQEIMEIKEIIENSKQDGVLEALKVLAVTKAQQQIPVPIGNDLQETLKGAAEQAVQQQIQNAVAEKIGPYQNIAQTLGLLQTINGKLNPVANKDNSSLSGAPQNYVKIMDMTATAYAPGPADNGIWGDNTYVGSKVRKGIVATDPRVIPMGTKLWVEGYGYAVAEDQGSAIKGNRIDLAYNDFQTASDYGIQDVKVYVLK